jgi:anthranilate synthase component 1
MGKPVIEMRMLPGDTDLLALHRFMPERYPLLLESVADGTPRSRWDLLFIANGEGMVSDGEGVRTCDGKGMAGGFLDALDAAWSAESSRAHASARELKERGRPPPSGSDLVRNIPFTGGLALYLGYEVVGEIEPSLRLPPSDAPQIPTALALRCPAALLRDRELGTVIAIAEQGFEGLLDVVPEDLLALRDIAIPLWQPPVALDEDDPQRFLDGVARVHEHLVAGDVFQVNLSRAWRARFAGVPAAGMVYERLRAANPAPFAASLVQPGWALASSSPERLISVRDGTIETRPIAGTRPRLVADDEAECVRELVGHPKERAEHVMLIDLERNDLGRVCVPGSVVVDELMVVESYAHVHHIVSNVRGKLREDITPADAIRAVFPGGTITGCPKVRCMQIIAELEGVGRGEYTGALGYLDRSGDMDLNILIRSFRQTGDSLHFRAGAGIVADSVAALELDETRAKARGLLRALDPDT